MRLWYRFGLALTVALWPTLALHAQTSYLAFEQITVAGAAIGLTAATINAGPAHGQANSATCRLETAEIRYRVDGPAATASVGMLLEPGDTIVLSENAVLQAFSAIRTGTTSGVLDCTESS